MGALGKATDAFADRGGEASSAAEPSAPSTKPARDNKSDTPGAEDKRLKPHLSATSASTVSMSTKPDSNSSPPNTSDDSSIINKSREGQAIDTRLPHRHGWPLLPSLPVSTSTLHIPKALSKNSTHMHRLRAILTTHAVTIHSLSTTHRFHATTPLSKSTLTLLVASDTSNNSTWVPALASLRTYITTHALTLAVEIIDHRILHGVFTLPILAHDPLAPWIAKKKRGVVDLLDGCGAAWTSLEVYYRGVGGTRAECRATVLIGVPEPEEGVWWEGERAVVRRVAEKVGGRLGVEVVWRRVVKY